MAMEMHVFYRGKLPTKTALNRAMKELGLPLAIKEATRPLEQHTGFMPMRWRGEDTGVEFDVWSDPTALRDIGAEGVDPSFDRTANFRWGGDFVEMLSAQSVAAALAKLTGGVVFEPEGGALLALDEAIGAARATLQQLTADDKPTVRGTRKADLKHYLKPLLKARPDLILRDRFLFMTPVRHMFRGVLFDRSSDIYEFPIKLVYGALCARLDANDRPSRHMEVREPYFQSLLFDVLPDEMLEKVGQLTSLSGYAHYLIGRASPLYEPRLLAHVLAGERDRAEELVCEAEADENFPRFWIDKARSFIRRDIELICAESREREAKIAEMWELGDAWNPTPFPVELPIAERRSKTDDLPFHRTPWPARPDNLYADVPERPGEVKFACGYERRGDSFVLLSLLGRKQAQILHRNHEPYCMCTRLAQGELLIVTRGERQPFYLPKGGKLIDNYTVVVRGADRAFEAKFYASYDPEVLRLKSLDVAPPSKPWSAFNYFWQDEHYGPHITITEREKSNSDADRVERELPMAERELAACQGQIPEFSDYATLFELVNRYSNFLGYGNVTG